MSGPIRRRSVERITIISLIYQGQQSAVHQGNPAQMIVVAIAKETWFRRIATRYDKLNASFLGFVYLAAIAILLI